MVDLLGERERGKAKEIQHRAAEREEGTISAGRLVQSTSCRFGFVQQAPANPRVASSHAVRGPARTVRKCAPQEFTGDAGREGSSDSRFPQA